jgi:hypothetical protein
MKSINILGITNEKVSISKAAAKGDFQTKHLKNAEMDIWRTQKN